MIKARNRLVQLFLLAAAAWSGMYARSALGSLQETVRHSLSFSDNQMALLQGMAMALPMALASTPLGLLADRVSRARMLQFAVALGIASFAFTAIASDFALLFMARCLAGLSSAAILVTAFSMVGDLYPPTHRGRASMVVAGFEIVGAPVAFAIGGACLVTVDSTPSLRSSIFDLEGWRGSLLIMGALLVPVLFFLLRLVDPPRSEIRTERPSLRAVLPDLWRYRAIALPVLLARAMVWLADGAVFVWTAPTLARRFDMSPDQIGATMGTVLLASGLLGPVLGGSLADCCQRWGGPRRTMFVLSSVALVSAPFAMFGLMPTPATAALTLAVFLTLGFTIGTAAVTLSIIVIPGELRGFYLGITLTVGSLFFVGLAPLVVSTLSGLLGGEAMVGRALAIVCCSASVIGSVVFVLTARNFASQGHHSIESRPIVAQHAG